MLNYVKSKVLNLLPYKYRMGKYFRRTYNFLRRSRNWSLEELKNYQLKKLRENLINAYENVPYYRRLFKSIDFDPYKFSDFSEMKKIPILNRDTIRKNLRDFISGAVPKEKLLYVTTGGSTGTPLGFYLEKGVTYRITLAFEWRQYNEGGYYFGDKIALLRGKIIKDGIFEFDKSTGELHLSTYKLNEKNFDEYVKIMERFGVKHIRAYPSVAERFAKFVAEKYPDFNREKRIKSLFTSSEVLFPFQRELIEKALRCKVFDKYGNREQCGIIGQCKYGRYHDYMEYSYIEVLDKDGEPIEEGEGRMIVTSFVNRVMPFIRYDVGDIIELAPSDEVCKCGMAHRQVSKIVGRTINFVVDKDRCMIPITGIYNSHYFEAYRKIRQISFYQDTPGKIIVKIYPTVYFNENDRKEILEKLYSITGDKMDYEIIMVDEPILTSTGKEVLLVQKIDLDSIH